jgi:hypothetical protein
MNFNESVKNKIFPFIKNYGFFLKEEFEGMLRFDSKKVSLQFSYHARSNEFSVFVGYKFHNPEFEYLDFNYVVQALLTEYKRVITQPADSNIESLIDYYLNILVTNLEIVKGDTLFLGKLEKSKERKIEDYNENMILDRVKLQANNAWGNKDYSKLIEIVTPYKDELSPVFIKKLNFAKKKLGLS